MTLLELLAQVTWRDVLDVLLVALVIYNLVLLIRGTRAVQVILGLVLLVGAYYLARLAQLLTLQTTLENVFSFLPFAVIVLFQDEIRRALAQVGRKSSWGLGSRERFDSVIGEIVLAATALSSRRVGALIVVERLDGLKNYIENGIRLDAVVTYDLLMNIFTPKAPLHDGAVILQGDRIAAAACFLPVTLNPELSKDYGTRHRAALGISEQTDAAAVVVSEETGAVSIALHGDLMTGLSSNDLRSSLYRALITDLRTPAGASG